MIGFLKNYLIHTEANPEYNGLQAIRRRRRVERRVRRLERDRVQIMADRRDPAPADAGGARGVGHGGDCCGDDWPAAAAEQAGGPARRGRVPRDLLEKCAGGGGPEGELRAGLGDWWPAQVVQVCVPCQRAEEGRADPRGGAPRGG